VNTSPSSEHTLGATPLDELSNSRSTLQKELDRLQFGPAEKYISIEQIPIGFGGQISGRLLGLKLALALERIAVFRYHSDPPYLQTLEPQYSNAPNIDWNSIELFDPLLRQTTTFIRYDYLAASKRLLLSGESKRVETLGQKRVTERYCLAESANVDGEILNWMQWLPSIRSDIEASRARLGVSASTLGVHLRRGDKTNETAYIPANHINAAIARIYQTWEFESVFLASDSPNAPAEIDLPPNVKLIFDSNEKRYNNANHKMLFRNPILPARKL
jgi:hypothetical protein